MNNKTKRTIKNAAKTGGKYALKGVKFAGKAALSTTQFAAKTVGNVMKSPDSRKILSKAGTIAASVAFAGPAISLVAMNYLFNNVALGKNVSPLDALSSTFNTSQKVLEDVLGVISVPTAVAAKGVEKMAKKGKDALDR